MARTPWFNFKAVTDDPTVADIYIVDFIGDWYDEMWRDYGMSGVTAKSFIEELGRLSADVKTIRVHINSPGGDVFGAVNIANALREQQTKGRTVETIAEGLAASAASVVLMAGTVVRVSDNALIMIHNPWSIGIGDSRDMRKLADTLDTVRATIIATYRWHSALEADAIAALMNAETWMDADQAIERGFATEKVEGLPVAASIDARAADRLTVPARFQERIRTFLKPAEAGPTPASPTAVLKACKAAGCLELAEELLAANATAEQVETRVGAARQQRLDAAARAEAISAACTLAKLPELATGYIAGAMSADAVKAHLTTITARLDKVEIDNTLNPDAGARKGATVIDYDATYRAMNRR